MHTRQLEGRPVVPLDVDIHQPGAGREEGIHPLEDLLEEDTRLPEARLVALLEEDTRLPEARLVVLLEEDTRLPEARLVVLLAGRGLVPIHRG